MTCVYLAVANVRIVSGERQQNIAKAINAIRIKVLIVTIVWQCTQQIQLDLITYA